MTIMMLIYAFFVPMCCGFILISILQNIFQERLASLEKISLSFLIGVGLMTFYMFYLGLLKIPLTFFNCSTILIWAGLAGGILFKFKGKHCLSAYRHRKRFGPFNLPAKFLIGILGLLLIWKLFFVGVMILGKPTYFDDSVSNYNYKAKNFYYNQALVLDPEHPDFLGGHEPRYPDLNPLFKSWVSICIGHWEEYAVNLNTLFYYLSLGLIMFYGLIRFLPPLSSFIFTYLLMSIPLLVFHAGFAYMDLLVCTYFSGGMIYLFRWIKKKDRLAFMLSALLFGAGLFAKDEVIGLFVGGAFPLLIVYQILNWEKITTFIKTCGIYLGTMLILNLPWFAVKKIFELQSGPPEHYRKFEFHPEAFGILSSHLFSSGNYNLLWPIFAGVFLCSLPLLFKTNLKYIALSLAGTFAVILSLFIFTPFFEFLKIGTTINRALLSPLPIVLYYIAAFYGKLRNPDRIDS